MKIEDINKRLDVVLDYIMKRKPTWKICEENNISERTLRRWAKRYHENGIVGLEPKPTIPKSQPNKISGGDEELIVKTKLEHPSYGSRMIKHLLGIDTSHVTVNKVLRQHNLLTRIKPKPKVCKRFERKRPDSLWQMDIYEFRIKNIGKVYIFNIEDDHSRYVCASKIFTVVPNGNHNLN